MEFFPPFLPPARAHLMLIALPFPPGLAADIAAVPATMMTVVMIMMPHGDIAIEREFISDIHIQFAQANLLSTSKCKLIKEYS